MTTNENAILYMQARDDLARRVMVLEAEVQDAAKVTSSVKFSILTLHLASSLATPDDFLRLSAIPYDSSRFSTTPADSQLLQLTKFPSQPKREGGRDSSLPGRWSRGLGGGACAGTF